MKLQKLALIAEIVGGLGIIVSILYLGYEVSQNTATQALGNQIVLANQTADLRYAILADPGLADMLARGYQGLDRLDESEVERFLIVVGGWADIWQNAIAMGESGQLAPEVLDGWDDAMCRIFQNPGNRQG